MVKLPGLVSTIAEFDGRDRATLDLYARTTREAGLITTTKRGSGAAEMTARDAANLLVAIAAADRPKDAAMTVSQYRSLVSNVGRRSVPEGDSLSGVFEEIDEAPNFGMALDALMAGAFEILTALSNYIDDAFSDRDEKGRDLLRSMMFDHGQFAGVEVKLTSPIPAAKICVYKTGSNGRSEIQYLWSFMVDVELMEKGLYPVQRSGITRKTIIGTKFLLRLGIRTLVGHDFEEAERLMRTVMAEKVSEDA